MSILRRIFPERRDITWSTLWGAGLEDQRANNDAGVRVNQTTALGLTTVYACVSLLADTVSTLPVGVFRRSGAARIPLGRPAWMFQPEAGNPSTSWETHISEVMVSLLLDGNAYVWTVRGDDGELLELTTLDPSVVTPKKRNGRVIYELRGERGPLVMDDTQIRHIWRIRRPGSLEGMSPIEAAAQSLGKALAAEKFGARFFGRGATLSGVIEAPIGTSKDAAEEMKDQFSERFAGVGKSFNVGVLAGSVWKPLGVKPEEAQFIETMKLGVEDVARLYRVPPHLVGSNEPGAVSYASVEHRGIEFEKYTIRPYVEALETAYRPLLPAGVFMKLNTNGLLRGDFESRVKGYRQMWEMGAFNADRILALEDQPPLPNGQGQTYYYPAANFAPIGTTLAGPAPEPEPRFQFTVAEGAIRSDNPVTVHSSPVTIAEGAIRSETPVNVAPAPITFAEGAWRVDAPITVEPTQFTIAEGAIRSETPVTVHSSPVTIAEGAIRSETPVRVEPAAVTIEEGAVRIDSPVTVESPEMRIDKGAVQVHVASPDVNVEPAQVTVELPSQKATRKRIERDAENRISAVIEEPED